MIELQVLMLTRQDVHKEQINFKDISITDFKNIHFFQIAKADVIIFKNDNKIKILKNRYNIL